LKINSVTFPSNIATFYWWIIGSQSGIFTAPESSPS